MPTQVLTQQNFEQTISRSAIVLVDFWASWCGWCTRFAPIYEESSTHHPDIVYGTVDTEAEQALTAAAQITSLPTLLGFREGLLVYSNPGFQPAGELEEIVQQIQWMDMDEVRRQLAATQPENAAVGGVKGAAEPVPSAGLADAPTSYGWPGLKVR
ncbi:thioredoxin domain-containing protein [Nocardia sp. BMG51109]|uniref:thioredoxin family protein n=1 Tax=Nocardia sp. BMG51109 TaxID=1056816 RepID=UPI0004630FCE